MNTAEKKVTVKIPDSIHLEIKIRAAKQKKTVEKVTEEILKEGLKK